MIARFGMVSVALLLAGFCAGDDKKDDKELLQGEWTLVSIEVRGKESKNGGTNQKLVIKGDEWTAPSGRKLKFEVNATKSPKQLDLTGEKDGMKATWEGIYKIDGDTLTFCRPGMSGGTRPTEFKGGPMVVLMVFKRAGK